MGYVYAVVLSLVAGFIAGVIFSGKVQAEIKEIKTILEAKLTAIEAAITKKL